MNAVKLLAAVHLLIDGLGKYNFECKELDKVLFLQQLLQI